jgi:hypothetical protein
MAKSSNELFSNELLEEALEKHKVARDLQEYLKKEANLEKAPSAATIMNRVFKLSQLKKRYYEVVGLDKLGKKTKDYVEYNSRGIFIPASMLQESGFTAAIKGDMEKMIEAQDGQKFKVDCYENVKITLTPMVE